MITLGFTRTEDGKRWNFDFGSYDDHRHTGRDDIANDLQICLDEISKPYPRCDFSLILSQELITKPALALLVQLLNQPYTSQSSSTTEPTTITGDETAKWWRIEFSDCWLALPDSTALQTPEDKELYCSPDDIQIFGLALSLGTKELTLRVHECPDILHAVCEAPKLEISDWSIYKQELSALDCARLANSLQRSMRPPIILRLYSDYLEDPLVLAEGLVNVKELYMCSATCQRWSNSPSARPSYPLWGDVLVGEGGNGMMQRFLPSPSSQLKKLCLAYSQLEDCHFMAFFDMLPTSQLEELCLPANNVSRYSIMAFAHQLPRITCLRKVLIGMNDCSITNHVHLHECCMALTRGMYENYSIEDLFVDVLKFSRCNEYRFYANLNHAGRRILKTSKPVHVGLWPWILERAGTKCFRHDPFSTREEQETMRVNSIYFLLQNCQALLAVQ